MSTMTGEVITVPQRQAQEMPHGVSQADAAGNEISRSAETTTSPLEAQSRAMVQARFYIAQNPGMQRDWEQVERKLTKECKRPGFAWASWFRLPIGNDPKKYPEGFTIRFAEAALRMAKNIDVQQTTVFDDQWRRIIRITVLDLEANFGYTSEVAVEKTVERRDPKDRVILGERMNSDNKKVYIVQATEQEMAMKANMATSKAIRTNGLRLIPGDILAECKATVLYTRQQGQKAEDPEMARKTLLDEYFAIGVMPDDIGKFLGHKTEILSPEELVLLREALQGITEGMTTWREIMASREEDKASKQSMKEPQRTDQPRTEPQPQQAQQASAPQPEPSAKPKPASQPQQEPQKSQPATDLDRQAAAKWPDAKTMEDDFRTTVELVGPEKARKFFADRKLDIRTLAATHRPGQCLEIYHEFQKLIPDQKGGKGELFNK